MCRVFQLHNLLSKAECDHYIGETERVGYRDLSKTFDAKYRSNDRVLVLDESLADSLWNRIRIMLNRSDIIRVRPMCFGNGGTWKPTRLNECFKFNRYKAGGHFSPHLDGPWVPRDDESSIYTGDSVSPTLTQPLKVIHSSWIWYVLAVIIYLNDNFEGGATRFWSKDGDNAKPMRIIPRAGTALIFNHGMIW
jgi:hypothetical protein